VDDATLAAWSRLQKDFGLNGAPMIPTPPASGSENERVSMGIGLDGVRNVALSKEAEGNGIR
jgi:hypothetical protein